MKNSEIAARWWASVISDSVKKDNGDTSLIGIVGNSMYEDLADRHVPTGEQIEIFTAKLTEIINSIINSLEGERS